MPAIKYLQVKPKPKVNYLRGVFASYRAANGLTSESVAEKLGCSAQNVRAQWAKPAKEWKIGALMDYCDVMGIPYSEALEAAVK